ncbi:TadE/TadG family type IV pilus assembly protein [Candidatus Entotheonella palauensis]|uniref:TadE-like domain-containing protein n=1 Tax=Candidatus Entotheonella gemina TaxID=1429439 RepID=W4MAQ2_9BACT|nr:TadE family protein [Candidatus Entotheonella palauensis]ETX06722.1 MAG: hypothetical protein ETSY2_15450 [Candidatus Entotheonella gemina]
MFKRRFYSRKGIAAIEFAIILPFLLAFLGSVIDFGVAFFVSHTVQNAAREGARLGITIRQGELSTLDAVVRERVNGRLPPVALFDTFRSGISHRLTDCPNSELEVTVQGTSTYFFLQAVPFLRLDTLNITRKVKMRYEHCPS